MGFFFSFRSSMGAYTAGITALLLNEFKRKQFFIVPVYPFFGFDYLCDFQQGKKHHLNRHPDQKNIDVYISLLLPDIPQI